MGPIPDDEAEEIEVTGEMDPHGVEAVRLELRRLARRHGVDVSDFRAEVLADGSPGPADR
jgi:hypothetical protein